MIKFEIPESINYLNIKFEFKAFFGYLIDNVPDLQKSLTLSRRAMKLIDIIDAAKSLDVVEIEDVDTFVRIVDFLKDESFELPILSVFNEGKQVASIPSRFLVKFCDLLEASVATYKNDQST